jgi:pimeloyl-ACP methyl ester carboxylesterase
VAAFTGQYRCVRFTLPGFGAQDERRTYSLPEIEAVYRNVIEHVSPGAPVILLVHDWGAIFGYRFLRNHPKLVNRLIGVDIGDAGSKRHLHSMSFSAKVFMVTYQLWLALAWRLGPWLGDAMTRAFVRRIPCPAEAGSVSSKMNYPYWMQWTGAAGGFPGSKSPEPHCPMLFIYGERKPAMFHSKEWAGGLQDLPGCAVRALPTGHWVMADAPEAFNSIVLRWLQGPCSP